MEKRSSSEEGHRLTKTEIHPQDGGPAPLPARYRDASKGLFATVTFTQCVMSAFQKKITGGVKMGSRMETLALSRP